jgi:hypothetical protein
LLPTGSTACYRLQAGSGLDVVSAGLELAEWIRGVHHHKQDHPKRSLLWTDWERLHRFTRFIGHRLLTFGAFGIAIRVNVKLSVLLW